MKKIFYSNIYYEERLENDLFNLALIKYKFSQDNYEGNGYDINIQWLDYSVCPQKLKAFDGKYYEGFAMIPDHLIQNNTPEMPHKKDAILDFAITNF